MESPILNLTWSIQDRYWFALSLVLSAAIYLYTMWPSVAGGDAGELTAVAKTLGIVHPPGYPLYTMIAHTFSLLPFGTVGWRVNLFSVICSVGAQAFLFLTLRRLLQKSWLVFSLVGLFAFSTLTWRYAILAEVFSLNNFFVSILIYGAVCALQERRPRIVYLLAFLFGLGLTNHHTLVFIGGPLGLFLIWQFRETLLRLRPLLLMTALFLIGLIPYMYLFWASARAPLISWGDISTWQGFLTHLLRKEYGTFQLATAGSNRFQLLYGLWFYLLNLGEITGYVGLVMAALGAHFLWRSPQRGASALGRFWLVLPILYLLIFHYLANLPFVDGAALYRDIVSRFWLMPNLLMMIPLGFGALALLQRATPSQQKFIKVILVAAPFAAIAIHFRTENHRNNLTFTEFGKYLLVNLPKNAVFFTLGDINTNSVRYLQSCEDYRTDIKVLDRSLMSYPWLKRLATKNYPDLILPGTHFHPTQPGGYDFKRLFDANVGKGDVYITMIKTKDSNEAFDKAWEASYILVPYGLSFKVQRKSDPFDIDQYVTESAKYLVDPIAAFTRPPLPDSWDAVIQANYWLAHHVRAAEILKYGLKTQEKKYLELAEHLLEELLQKNPGPPADYFKNAGIAHQHLSKLTEGEEKRRHETRMLEVWELYINRTDRRDKTYDDIRTVLKAYGRIK